MACALSNGACTFVRNVPEGTDVTDGYQVSVERLCTGNAQLVGQTYGHRVAFWDTTTVQRGTSFSSGRQRLAAVCASPQPGQVVPKQRDPVIQLSHS
jgi:hypothetical protein